MFSNKDIEKILNNTGSLAAGVASVRQRYAFFQRPPGTLTTEEKNLSDYLKENKDIKGLQAYAEAAREYTEAVDRDMRIDLPPYGCDYFWLKEKQDYDKTREFCLKENLPNGNDINLFKR